MEMYEKGISINKIANKYKISGSRVRQIINNEPNYCVRHSKYFEVRCPYCETESIYKQIYEKSSEVDLIVLSKDLEDSDRSKQAILRKRIFVRVIRDKYKYSFSKIGRLLKKDHTTIMNLYYN